MATRAFRSERTGRGFLAVASLCSPVLFPSIYPWIVGTALLDILTTWVILGLGGTEVNPVAARAISLAGPAGMVVLKFVVVALVLWVCEYTGRARKATGRRLALCSVLANSFPVGVGVVQLALYAGEAGLPA